jgi:hypothetical protein
MGFPLLIYIVILKLFFFSFLFNIEFNIDILNYIYIKKFRDSY